MARASLCMRAACFALTVETVMKKYRSKVSSNGSLGVHHCDIPVLKRPPLSSSSAKSELLLLIQTAITCTGKIMTSIQDDMRESESTPEDCVTNSIKRG